MTSACPWRASMIVAAPDRESFAAWSPDASPATAVASESSGWGAGGCETAAGVPAPAAGAARDSGEPLASCVALSGSTGATCWLCPACAGTPFSPLGAGTPPPPASVAAPPAERAPVRWCEASATGCDGCPATAPPASDSALAPRREACARTGKNAARSSPATTAPAAQIVSAPARARTLAPPGGTYIVLVNVPSPGDCDSRFHRKFGECSDISG
jgi:hypothetical protein